MLQAPGFVFKSQQKAAGLVRPSCNQNNPRRRQIYTVVSNRIEATAATVATADNVLLVMCVKMTGGWVGAYSTIVVCKCIQNFMVQGNGREFPQFLDVEAEAAAADVITVPAS